MNNAKKNSLPQPMKNFLLRFLCFLIAAPLFANGAHPTYGEQPVAKSNSSQQILSQQRLIQANSNQLFNIGSIIIMFDTDMDGVLDIIDIDDDNDGIPDTYEYCSTNSFNCSGEPSNPSADSDNDGIPNYMDANSPNTGCLDENNDGICDRIFEVYDKDGDNVPDHLDLDGDNDGISDLHEVGHGAPDTNGDGIIDGAVAEFGGNGLYNGIATKADDLTADINYIIRDTDNDDIPDHDDLDVDHDGGSDIAEAYDSRFDLNNDGKFDDDETGPQVGATGIPVFQDPAFTGVPMEAPRDSDGDGIEDYRDLDSDNDGLSDVIENNFNNDPDNDGMLGGAWETANSSGFANSNLTGSFQSSTSALNDVDGDGYLSFRDLDSDNDGINDIREGSPFQDPDNNGLVGVGIPTVDARGRPTDFLSSFFDKDADGFPNFLDLDSDNDGVNDAIEAGFTDSNNDGFLGTSGLIVNSLGQPISDDLGTTLASSSEVWELDFDFIVNFQDLDSDNDGINDVVEAGFDDLDNDGFVGVAPYTLNEQGQIINPLTNSAYATSIPKDFDGDGIPDMYEYDSDNDGLPDSIDSDISDPDENGIIGVGPLNTNSFGQPISDNAGNPLMSTSLPLDTDGDGFPNYNDLDSDGDDKTDAEECPILPCTDFDEDGIPEFIDTECNVFLADPIIVTDAVVCANEMITLNLFEVHPSWNALGANLTFTWKNGAGDVIGNTINPVTIPADDAAAIPPYTLQVAIPECTSSVSQPTTVTANVIPAPIATNSGFICAGENATLFAESIPGAMYQWRVQGNPNIFSTAQNPVVFNITRNTVYELTIISNGCRSTTPATTAVQLHTPPDAAPNFNYEINALDCTPEALSLFSNFAQGSAPIANASWIGPSGFFSDQINPVINNPSSANNGTYVLTATDQNGCSLTRNIQINEIVDSPQPPQISPLGNNCNGTLISLSATTYVGSNVSYVWQLPAGANTGISGQNTNVLTIDPFDPTIHTGNYIVQVFLDDCSMTSVAYELEQAQKPEAQPFIQLGTICEGEEIQFFANGSNTSNIVSYQWSGPNGFISNNQNPRIFNADISDNGCYSLTVTNSIGCSATEQVCVSNIQQKPTTPMTSNNGPVCVGDDINLCSATTYVGTNVTYNWRNANGTNIGNSNCITFASDDINMAVPPYNLQVNVDGCVSDFSASIQIDEFSSLPPMSAFLNSNPCVGESFQLFAAFVPQATYEWRLEPNGPVLYSTQNPIIVGVTEPTTYEVTAITTGCLQEPVATVTVNPAALPNITDLAVPATICEGSNLVLEGTTDNADFSSMTYTWTGPDNFMFSNSQTAPGPYIATIPTVTAVNEGIYSLQVTNQNGCVSNEQSVQVSVLPQPAMPQVFVAANQICFGENISLSANDFQGSDVTYEWRFNDGTGIVTLGTSAIPTFEINEVDESNQGAYTVIVNVDGCPSMSSLAENIIVDGLQEAPNAENPTSISNPECVGSTIQLMATSDISGATYQWFNPNGDQFSSQQNPILQNITIEDAGEYYVIVSFGVCPDVTSNLTEVFINETPEVAILENNGEICAGSFAEITATNITVEPDSETQFNWYNAATGILIDSTSTPSLVTDEFTGNTNVYLIFEVNGCESPQSENILVEVSEAPPENAFAGLDAELCNTVSYDLAANTQSGITGEWTSPTGASISDPTNANSNATNLIVGENIFVWSISNAVCTDFSRDSVFITIDTPPLETPNAGIDINLCEETTTSLNATPLTTAVGNWSQSVAQTNQGVVIADPTSPVTAINGLSAGQSYTFFWTLSSGACIDYDQDVVDVNIETSANINAVDDQFTVSASGALSDIDLLENDNTSGENITFTIIDSTIDGALDVDGNGVMSFVPSGLPSGATNTGFFTYEICSIACLDNCSTATVEIQITQDVDCFVTGAITPNGDGKNDFLEIPCLISYPDNELMIFNRWGDKVFEQTNYQGDWNGDRKGVPLPNGTYFYILNLDADTNNSMQGYFSIVR